MSSLLCRDLGLVSSPPPRDTFLLQRLSGPPEMAWRLRISRLIDVQQSGSDSHTPDSGTSHPYFNHSPVPSRYAGSVSRDTDWHLLFPTSRKLAHSHEKPALSDAPPAIWCSSDLRIRSPTMPPPPCSPDTRGLNGRGRRKDGLFPFHCQAFTTLLFTCYTWPSPSGVWGHFTWPGLYLCHTKSGLHEWFVSP